jgi:hypothetical protein
MPSDMTDPGALAGATGARNANAGPAGFRGGNPNSTQAQQIADLAPAVETIAKHLQTLTFRWDELGEPCLIELVFLSADDVAQVKDVRHFVPTDEGIREAAEHAAKMNAHQVNAYVVVNPVSATNRPKAGKRASAEHIVAALFHFADGDDAGASARIRSFVGPKPTFWVNTGMTPYQRPHIYWAIEVPTRNLLAWTGTQRAIAAALGTDGQVIDPPRIMRLAGTVNWPKPKKAAKGYVPEVVTLHFPQEERDPIPAEDMARAFAAPASKPDPNFIDTGPTFAEARAADDYAEILRRARTDGEKHGGVRDLAASLAGQGVNRALTEAIIREACPVWDANVERLISSAYEKFYKQAGGQGDAFEREKEQAGQGADQPGAAARDLSPIDLWGKFPPPALPRGLLPKVIEDFAFIEAAQMGADPGGLAAAALCVCCAAIPDRIKLRVKRHGDWSESARIWVAPIGDPSTKKSPIQNAAEKPLRELDHKLFRDFARRKAEYDALSNKEKAKAERPKHVRLRLDDTTIEAAAEVLADSPNGLLLSQDELAGWFGGMDRYGGKGKDRAFWLRGFNGGDYAVTRIGRGAMYVPNLSICVLGGIQPEPIRKVVGDAADDGLIQRLCPIVLRPATLGLDDAPPSDAARAYGVLVEQLTRVELLPPGGFIDCGNGRGVHLVFEGGAQAIRRELEQRHLDLMSTEIFNRKLASHIGKYDGLFARLCVAFHTIDHAAGGGLPQVITEDMARRVAAFMHRFLLPHAYAFYGGILDLSDDHDRLAAVAGYILAHGLENVSVRDVQRGDGTMRKLDRPEIERLMQQLESLGWVSQQPIAARSNASPTWAVNSEVHRLFGQRGSEEAERRQKARQLIQEAVQWRE